MNMTASGLFDAHPFIFAWIYGKFACHIEAEIVLGPQTALACSNKMYKQH